jgi:hypothetical protein
VSTYAFVLFLQAKDAKACMRLDNINVTIVPEKVGNPHGMQITFDLDSQIRSLYVYAENAQVTKRNDSLRVKSN